MNDWSFAFKLAVTGGPQITVPKGAPAEEAFVTIQGTNLYLEMSSSKSDGGFGMKFVGGAEASIQNVGRIGAVVTGELQRSEEGQSMFAMQAYAEGTLFGTELQTLFTIAKQGKDKSEYLAAIYFPKGLSLQNLPFLSRLPSIDKVPGLEEGAYFTLANDADIMASLLSGMEMSVARYGDKVDAAYQEGAKHLEGILSAGPPQKAGLVLPPTDIEAGELQGPLEPLNSLISEGSKMSIAGMLDPRRGEIELTLSLHGSLDMGMPEIAEFESAELDSAFKIALQDDVAGCSCSEEENCVSKLKALPLPSLLPCPWPSPLPSTPWSSPSGLILTPAAPLPSPTD